MLRLAGFFVVVLVALHLLRAIPVVGRIFDVPILGFWGAAILVALAASWLGKRLVDRRRYARALASLGATDTPQQQGKLGALLLAYQRPARALPHLDRAIEGEPEFVEWRWRRALARLALGRTSEAIEDLTWVAARDEEHGYGAVQLRLAEAWTRAGRAEEALAALDRFDRNHGESPESAYRRGQALRRAGRRAQSRAAFARVGELARRGVRYQRASARAFALRALLARLG